MGGLLFLLFMEGVRAWSAWEKTIPPTTSLMCMYGCSTSNNPKSMYIVLKWVCLLVWKVINSFKIWFASFMGHDPNKFIGRSRWDVVATDWKFIDWYDPVYRYSRGWFFLVFWDLEHEWKSEIMFLDLTIKIWSFRVKKMMWIVWKNK